MLRVTIVLLAVLAVLLAASPGRADPLSQPLIIMVRHAEKAADDDRDPSLSESGLQRAEDLAAALADSPPAAILVSPYRRTRLTAEPVARAAGVEPAVVPIEGDIAQYAQDVASAIEALDASGPVLVVGHSNTIPALIGAFGAREPEIAEDDYDHLYILRRWGDARVDLIQTRYGARSGE